MPPPVRMAVVGVGGIGRLHATIASRMAPDVELVAISDIDAAAGTTAADLGVPFESDYRRLLDLDVDGVVVAVPNHLHLEVGSFFAEHGVHILVEKPIADTVDAGHRLCSVAAHHAVHLLVGQHRRHNNLVRAAADVVHHQLGRLVATNAMVTMRKPDSYYEPEWRRGAAAGPLLVNLIHEVDLQRAVCGEIERVQAVTGRVGREFVFDDTAAVLLHFSGGAMGTMLISESTPSPWSWEASVSEGMGFHNAGQDNARFIGTDAALSFPSLTLWSYDPADGEPGWRSPLHARRVDVERNDPYAEQLSHFARVIRGREPPLVSGSDGLRSLAVVIAVIEAARTCAPVEVDEVLDRA